jgi:hypothetical protein
VSTDAPTLFDLTPPGSRAAIIPRYYQLRDHDETFRLWDSGTLGVLTRAWTGAGKTLQTCLKIDTWIQRGPNYRAMVISYEQELVHQFSREVWDYLGKRASIEMGEQRVDYGTMPEIVIASRQSLLCWPETTKAQRTELETFGITDTQSVCERHVKRYLKLLKGGKAEPDDVRDEIGRMSMEPEARDGKWSRVHRFDWHYNWLLCFDEAHKHAYHLKTVGHLIDWFGQNPETRWTGMSATPKRGDGVSIGHKMFPGIALDLPLFKPGEPCGVSDGWAVPYVQRYIEVEGVDFRSINRIGKDFDEADLERVLGKEETLAKLVEPLLDMVEDRQTLIFSPGVQMAKDVAEYINARSRCVCACGEIKWHPTLLIGDGATCPHCGRMAESADIDKRPEQAKELDGDVPSRDRTPIYEDHQAGKFQFLSVCGLCREGYNDCLSEDTEILGVSGWVGWGQVSEGDLVYSLNRSTGRAEIVPVTHLTRRSVRPDERMVTLTSQHMSVRMTEGHNVHAKTYSARHTPHLSASFITLKARELVGRKSEFAIPLSAEHDGFSGVPLSDDELRFVAWYLTEGYLGKHELTIDLSTNKRHLCERLRLILIACGFDFGERERMPPARSYSPDTPQIRFRIPKGTHHGKMARNGWSRLATYLSKDVSPLLHQMDRRQFKLFWYEMLLGDGSIMPRKAGWLLCDRKSQVDAYTAMAVVRGFATSYAPVITKHGTLVYRVSVRDSQFIVTRPTDSRATRIAFDSPLYGELVWCATNDNSTLITRRNGKVAILGNCNIACVAVFRPVSRAASSLAEQMKGRSCRPLRGLLDQWPREDQRDLRLAAIQNSFKPNALIVDLVGITGLADCASTIQIYTEGLPDEISKRAEEILLEKGSDAAADVGEAVEQAKREDAEARARAKAEREAAERHSRELAERRAKAGADVSYTVHESGIGSQVNANEASEKQYRMAAFLGMDIHDTELTKRQMGRIISQLQARTPLDEIARTNRIDERNWQAVGPTAKQKWAMHGLHGDWIKTRADASLVIDALKSPAGFFFRMHQAIAKCETTDALTSVARDIGRVHRTVKLNQEQYANLIEAGRRKRASFAPPTEF